ncbi:MAG TPA: iron-containing alcohol dehydrogenase, partial [Myxococcales bacterium]|nr:iron-containing alcohol dehydrogenase [Myxococcales bacterium]
MTCWHYYAPRETGETSFSIDASRIVFGRGALVEVGDHARAFGCRRVALFTDPRLAQGEHLASVRKSLQAAGVDCALYAEVKVEPTDVSFQAAAGFA